MNKFVVIFAVFAIFALVQAQVPSVQAQVPEEETAPLPWDGEMTVSAGEEFSMRFEFIESGDTFTGAFQTQNGEKINFFIHREKAVNEAPLAREYMVNECEFNATVPYIIDPITEEEEKTVATYLVVFDNKQNNKDIVVSYRLKIVKEQPKGRFGNWRDLLH